MKPVSTPPVASILLEAMRAFGYSFEAAVADLIVEYRFELTHLGGV